MSNGFAAATVLPFGHGGTATIPSVYLSSVPGEACRQTHESSDKVTGGVRAPGQRQMAPSVHLAMAASSREPRDRVKGQPAPHRQLCRQGG